MSALISDVLIRLDTIESLVSHLDKHADEVSAWSVGQQFVHVISATSAFSVMLLRDRKSAGSADQNPFKDPILDSGVFPRGVVNAPKGLDNPAQPVASTLLRDILKCRNRVEKLPSLSPDTVATHHLLGEMTRDEVIRFLRIHLDHHLAIVRDILAEHDVTLEQ